MTDEQLIAMMDELGQVMHDYEQAQIEFDFQHQEEEYKITSLKEKVREEILKRQTGYKSMKLECTWRKGATRWDGDKLKEYEKQYSFLKECKKVGDPTVGFRLRDEGLVENE